MGLVSEKLLPRIPIIEVFPVIEDGTLPAKATEGEPFPIRATVFREGHDAFATEAVLLRPDGGEYSRTRMVDIAPGLDRYEAWVAANTPGAWSFRVDSWSDPYATWRHDATVKVGAGVDVELMLEEGARLMERAAEGTAYGNPSQQRPPASDIDVLTDAARRLRDTSHSAQQRLSAGISSRVRLIFRDHPLRDLIGSSRVYPLDVARTKALAGAWYEIFPRSAGAFQHPDGTWVSGTLAGAADDLPRIAGMGFDVVYLTPVHPIGTTHRKGKNNALEAAPGDPGSPYAIGSPEGGHDAIHPELGDFADFDRFVERARGLGLEVALDLALQCSPDHPWVKEHPEWFTTRADGTIAYAENPPKKYQDIYPLNFDNDPEGIYQEVLRVVQLWIDRGVTIFRVDNPHTKPVEFWDWLLERVHETNPEVIFLAEAFTKPQMMAALGKVGFQQSYTYFTWRVAKWELTEYLTELSRDMAPYYRPNFFVNTPDILPFHLQSGNPAIFAIRAILAATLSPSWGVYSGFELFEHTPLAPGREEYLNSEKYEYRPRDFTEEPNLNLLLGTLNGIREKHQALQQLRDIHFHHAPHDSVMVYSKHDGDDVMLMVCSLDPDNTVESEVYLDLPALGLPPGAAVEVHDELSGDTYIWGERNWVRLYPGKPAHIFHVTPH